jgi:PAS domain S-box-containing protein
MRDEDKSKEELIVEVTALRRRVAALEASAEECEQVEAKLRDELAARKLAEVEIRRNEALLRQLAANIPGAVYQLLQKKDGAQTFPYISEGCYDLYGLSPAEVQADSARLFALIHPEDAARVQQASRESARTMAAFQLDHRVCKPDGTVVWLRMRSTPQRLPGGDILWHGVAIDITGQKQTEEALGESENRFRSLFENAGVSLWEEDFSEVKDYIDQLRETGIKDIGRFFDHHWQAVVACAAKVKILDVNETTLKLYKVRSKAQLLKNLRQVLSEESIAGFKEELIALAEGRLTSEVMSTTQTLGGDKLNAVIKWSVLPGYEDTWARVLVSIVDVTDLKQAEAQFEASLREKDVLLKEIHHRVKNNLTIISSLLELQVDAIQDERIRTIFRKSQARIYAMAYIHEHLYRSQNLAWIDMGQYIRSLGEYLRQSYSSNGIALTTEVANVGLDVDTAVPCGLIINELVSNALKHAFPPGRNGASYSDEIRIKLCSSNKDEVQLLVRDNGVGFPPDFDRQNGSSLGLELVERLTHQLRGSLERHSAPDGTSFKITFAKPTAIDEEVKS